MIYNSSDFTICGKGVNSIVYCNLNGDYIKVYTFNPQYSCNKVIENYNIVKQIGLNTLGFCQLCIFDGTPALSIENVCLTNDYVAPNSTDVSCKKEQYYQKRAVGSIRNLRQFITDFKAKLRIISENNISLYYDCYFFKISENPYDIDYKIADFDCVEINDDFHSVTELYDLNVTNFKQAILQFIDTYYKDNAYYHEVILNVI